MSILGIVIIIIVLLPIMIKDAIDFNQDDK